MSQKPLFLKKALLPKKGSITVILENPSLEKAEQEILDRMTDSGVDQQTIEAEQNRLGVERLKIDLVQWLKEFDGGIPKGGVTFSETTICTKLNKPKFTITWEEPRCTSDAVCIKKNMIDAVRATGGIEVNSIYTHVGY